MPKGRVHNTDPDQRPGGGQGPGAQDCARDEAAGKGQHDAARRRVHGGRRVTAPPAHLTTRTRSVLPAKQYACAGAKNTLPRQTGSSPVFSPPPDRNLAAFLLSSRKLVLTQIKATPILSPQSCSRRAAGYAAHQLASAVARGAPLAITRARAALAAAVCALRSAAAWCSRPIICYHRLGPKKSSRQNN